MKDFFRIALLFIVYSNAVLVQGQPSQGLSLTDCISLALKSNPTLRRSELEVARNEINHKQAQYNRLPSLNGNVSHSYNQGRSINSTTNQFVDNSYFSGNQSLSLNGWLFKGFELLYDIRRKANAREAGKLEFESSVNELKLDVIAAYVLVLTAQDMLKQTEAQRAVTAENVRRSEVLHREGAAKPGDYYDLKGQLESEENNVQDAQRVLYNNKQRLVALLNWEQGELPLLQPLLLPVEVGMDTEGELYEKALGFLPNFKALDWRIKEAEQGVKVARSGYYPSLSFDAGIQSRFSSVDDAGYNYWQQLKNYPSKGASLTLRVPIFNQMQVRNQVKHARLNLDEALWNRKIQENRVREETAKAVFSLTALRQNVGHLEEQEQHYREAFRIAQVHFDAGNSNSVLLLTAKTKLDNTTNSLLIKRYEWIMQKYINDYYAGKLEL
ncbi:TolC family protein [Sphingobacterium psychroaquaticum]|uniref:TolC family protein n=1 Tax=Sphingobacterium psychroaquaticum TaxID=561061 RepID=UPI00106D787B|nr:TolC family protein [Sphingobacterium psychroaquaticum]QBQ40114.1 TolC family protein [Sphingobacterium psychroaquaticum]